LTITQLQADLATLQAELTTVRAERDQLHGLLADLLAEQVQLRAQLADTQALVAAVEAEHQQTRQELFDLKRKPFTARSRSDDTKVPKPRGRPTGHVGSGRPRPTRIDQVQAIPAGDSCPDCGTAFTGMGTTRSRVVEDIVLVHPTVITQFVIERRWCPNCRSYHEDAVSAALPRHRLGLHVLLFVVYQKVALGLSYSKIQRELRSYFGLRLSAGELPSMVAEIAALFGPAYARLLELMRQQAAIHIDETSWPVEGVHGHLLPNGKVLFLSYGDEGDMHVHVWDPASNTFTPAPPEHTNVGCSGHAFLPDGRLLVAGGEPHHTQHGYSWWEPLLRRVRFRPVAGAHGRCPPLPPM